MTSSRKHALKEATPWEMVSQATTILNNKNKERDFEKAISLIHESGIHTVIAELYIDGEAVRKDMERARVVLEYGANGGCGYSKLLLALFYERGAGGLTKDHKKSFELIVEATETVFSGLLLARCFELGIGVPVDKEKSLLILLAAGDDMLESHGMHEECAAIARHYSDGIGTKPDPKAAKFYELLSFKIKG